MDLGTLPTTQEIVAISQKFTAASARPSETTTNCLDGVVGAVRQASCYQDSFDYLHAATHLLLKIARAHCLTDANKRTAWHTSMGYLLQFRLKVEATEADAAQFVIDVVEKGTTDEDAIEWFAQRLSSTML